MYAFASNHLVRELKNDCVLFQYLNVDDVMSL